MALTLSNSYTINSCCNQISQDIASLRMKYIYDF